MSTERNSLEIETLATATPSTASAPLERATQDGIFFGVTAPQPGVTRNIEEFHHDLCGCQCNRLCCVAFVCPLVVHAQLMQRLNLTLGGCRRSVSSTTTMPVCPTLVAIIYGSSFLVAVLWLVKAITYEIALDVFGVLGVFCLVAMVNTRTSFRGTYNVLPHTQNWYEDCCITLWCGPCSAIQMARHDNHSYEWYSTTGEIVV